MRPSGERFLDALYLSPRQGPTARAILAGVLWWDGDDWYIVHDAIGFHTAEELSPGGIMDALGKLVVLDQVADLKMFVGNQVVRRDERVRRFACEIFTLPLHFQIGFGQALSGLLAVLALFVFARHTPVETFEFRLSFSRVTWVLNCVPVGIGVESLQSHVDADDAASLDARKEHMKRGGAYWKAYRKRAGKLHRAYQGKSNEVTLERLQAVAAILASDGVLDDSSLEEGGHGDDDQKALVGILSAALTHTTQTMQVEQTVKPPCFPYRSPPSSGGNRIPHMLARC
jgi:hypothetical protein